MGFEKGNMTFKQLKQTENLVRLRSAGLQYRIAIHPEAFDGTRETYNEQINLAVLILKWAKAQADCVRNCSRP